MSDQQSVFVDEYGDIDIDASKQGSTTFFIVSAVIVPRGRLQAARELAEYIRMRNFQTGEMKSSGIGSNWKRRLKILEAIGSLPLKTLSIVVDKRELDRRSGLAYRKSFFKYLNRILYQRLVRAFPKVDLVADEHGTEQFMTGFEQYLKRTLSGQSQLFPHWNFRFERSDEEVLLQVADVISGSLGYCFDPKRPGESKAEMVELLSRISVGIQTWPPQTHPTLRAFSATSRGDLDGFVRQHCLRVAKEFLVEVGEDDDERLQAHVLELLLFQAEFVNDSSFLTTDAIMSHLNEFSTLQVSEHRLRTAAIGPMRDASVIIASGPKGYKIPTSVSDLRQFVAHAQSIVPRMLQRLRTARDELRLASTDDLDILAGDELGYLRRLVECD